MKVLTIAGTRPELIKLSLVLKELDKTCEHILVHTGQNYDYELNEVFFKDLNIRKPDYFLNAAKQSAVETISTLLIEADKVLEKEKPDALLIYGDTNSCLSAYCAKRRKIPIFHMEAGNRCFDQRVPEEINRKIVDHLSDVNMTITEHARRYLISEGLPPQQTIKVGTSMKEVFHYYKKEIESSNVLTHLNLEKQKYFVVSAHREENVDQPERLKSLIQSLNGLAAEYDEKVVFSVHPRTRSKLSEINIEVDPRVQLMKPLGFHDYIHLQLNSHCVISDSGTLTEESSLLGFPGIMIRQSHERPEGMDLGVCLLCDIHPETLLRAVKTMTRQSRETNSPFLVNDYANDKVSQTVVRIILSYVDHINFFTWHKKVN